MKVYSRGSVPPPSLWVVRDLQILHKAWRGQEQQGHFRSQNSSPPRPSPFSSRKKKKKKNQPTYSPDRTGWSCQNDGYRSIWDPAPWRLGGSQLPPFPGLSSLPPGQGEALRARRGGEHRGVAFKGVFPVARQAGKPSFWADVYLAVCGPGPHMPRRCVREAAHI